MRKVHTNCHFQSLELHKMSKLVPGYSRNFKKSPKVLLNHKVTYLVLWCKVSQNYKFSPCTLEIDINGPWDVKTLRKAILVLVLIILCRFGPYVKSLEELQIGPSSLKLAKIVPGYLKVKIIKTYPYTIQYWQVWSL